MHQLFVATVYFRSVVHVYVTFFTRCPQLHTVGPYRFYVLEFYYKQNNEMICRNILVMKCKKYIKLRFIPARNRIRSPSILCCITDADRVCIVAVLTVKRIKARARPDTNIAECDVDLLGRESRVLIIIFSLSNIPFFLNFCFPFYFNLLYTLNLGRSIGTLIARIMQDEE